MNWRGGHVTVSMKLLHLRFSLLLSHFQPIFVSFVAVSAVLSCMLFNSRPCQNNPDRSSMICECRSFGWFEWLAMIGDCVPSTSKQHPVTTSTKACPPKYSQKLLKPCWIRILTSDMALKQQGQKTRWNSDKPHTVLKMPVTLNANRGRVYSSEYKKPPHIWNSDQGYTNCPLRKPHCCSKRLKPFSLTHIFSYALYLSLCMSFQFYSL